ncbi:MAG: DUF721 domain-containing protein [candidate division KSB1 bacterium]|nr:DUF721 domain-containing protein [candidate division KSB1 bacterium]MDZ7274334.1 DUF721 domain-containing protein [candidate division KSB1 bacterium]MDZ7285004.1 DUF721 domain-containing protein [candidate division KSB1 bacterium]MDZ7297575.1 DUF721 domain-containing protein [candidate division KSB1 bacterium]MDZ7308834.1 DUF721 domain-containing protein [candidate division KSB1 bacterium]
MAKALGDVLQELLHQYGLVQRVKEYQAVNLWPEVVGEQVAKVASVREVRDGCLYVEVTNSVWRNELYYMKPEIIARINRRIGQNLIHDILLV